MQAFNSKCNIGRGVYYYTTEVFALEILWTHRITCEQALFPYSHKIILRLVSICMIINKLHLIMYKSMNQLLLLFIIASVIVLCVLIIKDLLENFNFEMIMWRYFIAVLIIKQIWSWRNRSRSFLARQCFVSGWPKEIDCFSERLFFIIATVY